MKRNLIFIASIFLILMLVMSLGISGCSQETVTTTITKTDTATTTTTTTTTSTATSSPTTTSTATTTEPTTTTTTTPAGDYVYVSVSVDGELLVIAEPIAYTEGMTVDELLQAAHEAFYSGGLDGYAAGIDPTWGMYLISMCWGVVNTPYIILNDAPLTSTVDVTTVAANDNVIIVTGVDTSVISPVSLAATVSGDTVTITATAWTLNFATFMYDSAPYANANVLDSTGAIIGTTDENGQITIDIPADGIVIIEGYAAINVNASAS